jgi:hypothetical protein
MESGNSKVVTYLLVIFAVMAIFGVAVMQLKKAAEPGPAHQMTQEERVKTLETATKSKFLSDQKFLQNEQLRIDATKEADQAVGQGR